VPVAAASSSNGPSPTILLGAVGLLLALLAVGVLLGGVAALVWAVQSGARNRPAPSKKNQWFEKSDAPRPAGGPGVLLRPAES
jgi:hypothetical protein